MAVIVVPILAIGLPLLAVGSSVIGVAVALGMIAISAYIFFEMFKNVARLIPGLRLFIPDDKPDELELSRRRLEAEEKAAQVAAAIEAELQEVEAARMALLPKTAAHAREQLIEAQGAVKIATAAVSAAEDAAKEHNGGWGEVCEAREALERAEALATEIAEVAAVLESPKLDAMQRIPPMKEHATIQLSLHNLSMARHIASASAGFPAPRATCSWAPLPKVLPVPHVVARPAALSSLLAVRWMPCGSRSVRPAVFAGSALLPVLSTALRRR